MAAGAIVDRWYRTTEDGQRVKTDPNGQGLRYRARYRLTPTREISKSFARVRDADDWLAQQRVDVGRGVRVDPARAKITVTDWAERWLATKVDLKPSTAARYRSILDAHVLPAFGSHRLEDVQHAQVQRWVAALSAALAPASVRKAHRVLSMLLDLAVKDDRLAKNPATGCALPRVVHAERRYLTHEQVWQLADLASRGASGKRSRKDERADRSAARVVVLVLAYCGLRWGELAALRVKRVDTMRRRITVAESVTEVDGRGLVWGTPKTHEQRSVPMPRFVADLLAEHIAGSEAEALVFTGQRSGGVLRGHLFRRGGFDRAADDIGVPGLMPHELRHTAASLAIASGADVKHVQRMLGHASAAMTLDRYGHLFEDHLDDVSDRLDGAVAALDRNQGATVRELRRPG